jgi:hypothetical protein
VINWQHTYSVFDPLNFPKLCIIIRMMKEMVIVYSLRVAEVIILLSKIPSSQQHPFSWLPIPKRKFYSDADSSWEFTGKDCEVIVVSHSYLWGFPGACKLLDNVFLQPRVCASLSQSSSLRSYHSNHRLLCVGIISTTQQIAPLPRG